MNTQGSKLQKALMGIAIVLSLILCIELAVRGYIFYQNTIFGKRPANEFSNDFDRVRVGFEYLLLNIIYFTWFILNKDQIHTNKFKHLLKHASIFLIIALMSYPITGDIFQYLHYGLMGLAHINPFMTDAGDFSSPFSPLLSWKQSSTYGPVSQLFFTIAAMFTAVHPLLSLYLFKLFCLIAHLANAFLIWKHLKTSQYQSLITFSYLISPYLLFEQVVNAHLDVFVCTILLLIIFSLRYQQYLISVALTWVGFLTKTLPIVWLPLIILFLFKNRGWKALLVALLSSALLILVLWHTALPGYTAWQSLLNPGVEGKASGSIQNLVQKITRLEFSLPLFAALKANFLNLYSSAAYLGFSLFYLYQMIRLYFQKRYTESDLVLEIGWVTLALFLFATAWYRPWYASILLPIAALHLQSTVFIIVSVVYSLLSSHYYYAFGPDTIYSAVTVLPPIVMLLLRHKLTRSPLFQPVAIQEVDTNQRKPVGRH
jgi:alpha-1,6-mannosyltransferase